MIWICTRKIYLFNFNDNNTCCENKEKKNNDKKLHSSKINNNKYYENIKLLCTGKNNKIVYLLREINYN